MTVKMSVRITLALIDIIINYNSNYESIIYYIFYKNPSAGIGRQDKLKLYWYKVVNVQVVSRIWIIIIYYV